MVKRQIVAVRGVAHMALTPARMATYGAKRLQVIMCALPRETVSKRDKTTSGGQYGKRVRRQVGAYPEFCVRGI